MKLFKKLVGACLAMSLCFSMASLVACGDKGEELGPPVAKESAYNFLVYNADGSAAVGYVIQLCTEDACLDGFSAKTDGNGFTYMTPTPDVYEVHVGYFNENNRLVMKDLSETVYTPAEFSTDFIEITLA